jgi:hypothetical protein
VRLLQVVINFSPVGDWPTKNPDTDQRYRGYNARDPF